MSAASSASLLRADLGVPGVQALTTLRGPVGVSAPPYDRLNLGQIGRAHV